MFWAKSSFAIGRYGYFGGRIVKELFVRVAERRLWSFLLLVLVGLWMNLPGSATLPLMDRDEPKFAQATWEMMETEQFTIPFFNKGYRFDKPPLTYWWMRAHYHLLGKTELAARLHSVFASILTAYVIYLFGSFLHGSRVIGLLSALAWQICLQVLVHSRLCVADMPMLLGVTITMYAIARLLFAEDEPRRFGPYYWLLVGGLAFGFLAKGPVAWIIPILALGLWCWPLGRQGFAWRRLQPVTSLLIATAVVSLWGINALIQTQGGYWDVGMGEHVVRRGVSAFNGRVNIPVVYYLVTGFISLLPWSAFLPGTVFASRHLMRADRKRAFLTAWFIAPFIVFALYATQLPHYILPGFPGLMLLLFADGKLAPLDTQLRRRWFWSVVGVLGFVSLVIILAGVLRIFPEPMDAMHGLVVKLGIITLLSGVGLPVALLVTQKRLSRWPLLLVVPICASIVTHIVTRDIRSIHPVVQLSEMGVFDDSGETAYAAQGMSEPSWVFYHWSGEQWRIGGDFDSAVEWLKSDKNHAGIFRTEEWRIGEKAIMAKWKGEPAPLLEDNKAEVARRFPKDQFEIVEFGGLNVARTSWVKAWFVRAK